MLKIFASNLLARREEKRYTQSYMAFQCGMSQPNYSDIERGKTSPSISQLKRFADVLETTVDDLLTEQEISPATDSSQAVAGARRTLSEKEKDTYIKILEERIRILLQEKDTLKNAH
jgi:transcriptional regulator with XRE-family HTH domain